MCDASNYRISAAILQLQQKKMNSISANSRQAELRLKPNYDSLHYERVYSNIIYTNSIRILSPWIKTSNNFIYRSQIYHILFTQNSNPNHRVHICKFLKYCNLHLLSTAGKKIALRDTITRNIPQELITRKTIVIIQQNIKLFLAKDETSSQLECRYAFEFNSNKKQINKIKHFSFNLECQNNHYEVVLTEKKTHLHPYSFLWTKNNTQLKPQKQIPQQNESFPIIEKEDLVGTVYLAEPSNNDNKYSTNKVFVYKIHLITYHYHVKKKKFFPCHAQ